MGDWPVPAAEASGGSGRRTSPRISGRSIERQVWAEQIDPDRIHGWIEGGNGGVAVDEGQAEPVARSLAFSLARTNVRSVVVRIA